uniref:uncharacterized protein LOC131127981 n=1 Tax=Doryrhamphus excisus TaxID=161450 RepID=UPI0025AE1DAB|nr:uncharacterized protein LOC131127981 [Doryrhamphus excisus]
MRKRKKKRQRRRSCRPALPKLSFILFTVLAMGPRKCFFRCEGKLAMFSLPTEETIRKKWFKMIIPEQQEEKNMFVCQRHFTRDCFLNMGQFEAGLSVKLLLKPDAFPTILGRREDQPGASQRAPPRPKHRHVGCQTDTIHTATQITQISPYMQSVGTMMLSYPSTKSVATQLSYSTLKPHVRSKGVQASVLVKNVATGTKKLNTVVQVSSEPARGFAPLEGARRAKRPRVDYEEKEYEEEEFFEESENEKIEESEYEVEEFDEDEEEDIEEEEIMVVHDSMYESVDSFKEPSKMNEKESRREYNDRKYIVFESCLLDLFQTCPVCGSDCQLQPQRRGTFVAYVQLCLNCKHTRKWQSQPLRGNTPVGNLQMSAAIYFTGGSFSQVDKIFKAMNVQMYPYDTFRRHGRNLLEPTINHKWKRDQQTRIDSLKQEGSIAVSGDMRVDSAGHAEKYGCYSLMHLDSNNIIDIQLVQSNGAGGGVHMEKEGLKRGLDHLEKNDVKVDYILTDRHTQVQTFLRERGITQYYDVWHLEKALSKKLQALAKGKNCAVLQRLLLAIRHHIYWTAMSSTSGPEKAEKWKSIVNHIQDIHSHDDPLYPKCLHAKKQFQPCTLPLYKVEKLLVNKRVLRDVEKLSDDHQTSSLESFHRDILQFAPKNVVLPYIGMLCRLYLAAMHFNENAPWQQTTLEFKEQATAKPVKTKPTSSYVSDLMRLLFEVVLEDPTKYTQELKEIPVPDDLCVQFERLSEDEVIATYVSRFSRGTNSGSELSSHRDQERPGVSGTQHTTEWGT